MPAVPVPEDEEEPIGRPGNYFDNPINRIQATSASPPWLYLGSIPVRHFGDSDWLR